MKSTGLSRISKELIIKEVAKELKSRKSFVIAQHGAVPAAAMDKLRKQLRASGTRYLVVKNSLGRKALETAKYNRLAESITGSCGIAFAGADIVASSKTLVDFAKANETFKIQIACFDGEIVTADRVKTLAGLPSREVLIARALGGMKAPISRFVGVLGATIRKVVTVIDAIKNKKAGGA